MKPCLSFHISSLLFLVLLIAGGCQKAKKDPSPQSKVVGRWALVQLLVSPPVDGVTDALALYHLIADCIFQVQLELRADGHMEQRLVGDGCIRSPTSNAGQVTGIEEGTRWAVQTNKLILNGADGRKEYNLTLEDQQMRWIYHQGAQTYTLVFTRL